MKITIELFTGGSARISPTKIDIDKNIAVLQRAIDNKPLSGDFVTLIDTKSILEQIRLHLPGG